MLMGVAALAWIESDNCKTLVAFRLPIRLAVFEEHDTYPKIAAIAGWLLGRPWRDTRRGSIQCRLPR
jgi:hypothetical protein